MEKYITESLAAGPTNANPDALSRQFSTHKTKDSEPVLPPACVVGSVESEVPTLPSDLPPGSPPNPSRPAPMLLVADYENGHSVIRRRMHGMCPKQNISQAQLPPPITSPQPSKVPHSTGLRHWPSSIKRHSLGPRSTVHIPCLEVF
ncbi:uncharacterized protein LOC144036899 [Vanacampus margaritifer]